MTRNNDARYAWGSTALKTQFYSMFLVRSAVLRGQFICVIVPVLKGATRDLGTSQAAGGDGKFLLESATELNGMQTMENKK